MERSVIRDRPVPDYASLHPGYEDDLLPQAGEGAVSLQRIVLGARNARGAVSCRRVGTSSLRKGELLHARSPQQPRMGIVSLVAARLVIDSVRVLALPDELLRDRPWLRPHGRIVDRDHVLEGIRR